MGWDIPDAVRAVQAFASGYHPDFPTVAKDYPALSSLATNPPIWLYVTRQDPSNPATTTIAVEQLQGPVHGDALESRATTGEVIPECEMEAFLVQCQGRIVGVRDDYQAWKGNRYLPCSGKPMWVTASQDAPGVHSIFFDDNIHAKVDDSIVAIRMRPDKSSPYRALSGAEMLELHDIFLVKAFIDEAVMDRSYFLRKIEECEQNFGRWTAR
eukprot:RCo035061